MAWETPFLCDAMLGGLARWLRVAGYHATFDPHAADGALVRRAFEQRLCLLTSDSGILERHAVAQGLVRCVFIPQGLSVTEQLAHVIGACRLELRTPKCMDCGGSLASALLAEVRDSVPPKVQEACREFFRCTGCRKVLWHGTHWRSIRRRLCRALALAGAARLRDNAPR